MKDIIKIFDFIADISTRAAIIVVIVFIILSITNLYKKVSDIETQLQMLKETEQGVS